MNNVLFKRLRTIYFSLLQNPCLIVFVPSSAQSMPGAGSLRLIVFFPGSAQSMPEVGSLRPMLSRTTTKLFHELCYDQSLLQHLTNKQLLLYPGDLFVHYREPNCLRCTDTALKWPAFTASSVSNNECFLRRADEHVAPYGMTISRTFVLWLS